MIQTGDKLFVLSPKFAPSPVFPLLPSRSASLFPKLEIEALPSFLSPSLTISLSIFQANQLPNLPSISTASNTTVSSISSATVAWRKKCPGTMWSEPQILFPRAFKATGHLK